MSGRLVRPAIDQQLIGDTMRGSGLIWTIVGILAIIALLIFIL